MPALMETNVSQYPCRRGKVRDVYDTGNGVVIATTDRHSAFDVNMSQGIPGKGIVLTKLSADVWPKVLGGLVLPFHVVSTELRDMPKPFWGPEFEGRTMLCHKTSPLPVECVVRGYIEGSGWKEYQEFGEVCGIKLPAGLQRCSRLPEPIFTPSTKAETGHDRNITFAEMLKLVGDQLATRLRAWSLALYIKAHEYALARGILIADTKFEFGLLDGMLMLIDEILTPDSSRFWPAATYSPGRAQPSMDKQALRDYLQGMFDRGEWNKQAPPPQLPDWLIEESQKKYEQIYRLLSNGDHLN
ncbi:MAG: phosphoribosylaminoimidazolesuccinocarboxamide synthase [Candidatus Staskawiczbacteria bacterium RIFOXYD1_FULL_39_28]|uniref:Phosphoribosylaminoimidazole-succinocarboxamide synthase n=1 Tax=Candidatus Staskawiczbacteria bacterium RIFOXYC1_FULL_38_18 TaxID=1802229 RepID=A0A1G2JD07_9BACT|nr:MAG: phosphoribosylaminoimidazolesuccinocarboxamide synthase [Candidatus Staskawiczbacteria bacterium RIFOXYC1_FULL_38_18]OGZ90309.1 MAG: phosphoribosylaminoimidazolesuccinocarboxamide synthase [Candidatus Staskawiczbacteria bacterium RIFOXYD1_FULL_39_28]